MSVHTTNVDAFQRVGDGMNLAVRQAFATDFPILLASEDWQPELVVAALAGMISAVGVICAGFEPGLDGDVLAGIVKDQFNAGRADAFALTKGTDQ